jgi:hypothetical protein
MLWRRGGESVTLYGPAVAEGEEVDPLAVVEWIRLIQLGEEEEADWVDVEEWPPF